MNNRFRKIPPVCLGIALFRLLTGRLKLSKEYLGEEVKSDDGKVFSIFRHIKAVAENAGTDATVFVVRFKFAHLSHKVNKLASIIPMLLIAGFPGFIRKMYAVDHESGYWQGMYEWESKEHLEEYKQSLVFRTMNKRAIKGSITSFEEVNTSLRKLI